MKKWDVWLAARYKSGAVDDEIEEAVTAKDFEEAYRKAKAFAENYSDEEGEGIEEVRIWSICIINEEVF